MLMDFSSFIRSFLWNYKEVSFRFIEIKKILLYSSRKNDLVLDPFLGSGQVAVVSKMLGRKYYGFEIVKEYYNFAKKRLEKNVYP